jgi:tRNA(fMet)-specific endonuclease VapC
MLLDTSVLIDIDRGTDPAKLEKLDQDDPHSISSVTVSEFYAGVHLRDQPDEAGAEKILNNAEEIAMEGRIARKAGELIARKIRDNLSLGINDIYIAATAIQRGDTLLTADTSDFSSIPELDLKDWNEY